MNEDMITKFANDSVSKLFKITFLIGLTFLLNPFISYLVFKNKGALEITFVHLF